MVTFSIINPPAGAVSWLADIETTPPTDPVYTSALTDSISLTAPTGVPLQVFFITYTSPVGTQVGNVTGVVGTSPHATITFVDGQTYTMDMTAGTLVGASPDPTPTPTPAPASGLTGVIPTIIEFMLVMMIMKMMQGTMTSQPNGALERAARTLVLVSPQYTGFGRRVGPSRQVD